MLHLAHLSALVLRTELLPHLFGGLLILARGLFPCTTYPCAPKLLCFHH